MRDEASIRYAIVFSGRSDRYYPLAFMSERTIESRILRGKQGTENGPLSREITKVQGRKCGRGETAMRRN